jgi:hypothetical protein
VVPVVSAISVSRALDVRDRVAVEIRCAGLGPERGRESGSGRRVGHDAILDQQIRRVKQNLQKMQKGPKKRREMRMKLQLWLNNAGIFALSRLN